MYAIALVTYRPIVGALQPAGVPVTYRPIGGAFQPACAPAGVPAGAPEEVLHR